MDRRTLLIAGVLSGLPRSGALAGSLAGKLQRNSLKYLASLQNSDGGFRAGAADGPSSLGPTTSCLRGLRYQGGRTPNRDDILRFLAGCRDHATGGFGDVPGSPADVRSTAVGLMALVELKVPLVPYEAPLTQFLSTRAKGLPEFYISAAALESAGWTTPQAQRWLAEWEATRNADGSYGKGPADTAGAVIITLRLGGTFRDPEGALRILKPAQKPDGGWAAGGDASDLSTIYRVMRCLHMLQSKPDLERLKTFVGRCRNPDGGYGLSPGTPSAAGPSYYAAIVLHWIEEMER